MKVPTAKHEKLDVYRLFMPGNIVREGQGQMGFVEEGGLDFTACSIPSPPTPTN